MNSILTSSYFGNVKRGIDDSNPSVSINNRVAEFTERKNQPIPLPPTAKQLATDKTLVDLKQNNTYSVSFNTPGGLDYFKVSFKDNGDGVYNPKQIQSRIFNVLIKTISPLKNPKRIRIFISITCLVPLSSGQDCF